MKRFKECYNWLWKNWWGLIIASVSIFILILSILWAIIEQTGLPTFLYDCDCLPSFLKYRFFYHLLFTFLISSILILIIECFFRYEFFNASLVKYKVHVSGYGWMKWICDGKIAGTFSEERRIEAIRIRPGNLLPANIGIVYECNFEGRGWMSPFKNGQQAGITGERKRLEAIKIRLEGDSKNFSVIYRVNIEGENWTDWSSNGQEAGTTGQSKRLEAIQISIIES